MKRPIRMSSEELTRELSRLADEGRDSLARRWSDLYGAVPPPRTSRSLMVRAVAYKMQEQVLSWRPAMRFAAGLWTARTGLASLGPARQAAPGTVLLREWRGKMHRVTIEKEGVFTRAAATGLFRAGPEDHHGLPWSGPCLL
jgi:hypothetical protein